MTQLITASVVATSSPREVTLISVCVRDGDCVEPVTDDNDPFKLHIPRWLNTLVATAAEIVLLVVTVAIITAMWLPAYLNSKGHAQTPVDRNRDDVFGMFPRGR
jgi:hypothetical protein